MSSLAAALFLPGAGAAGQPALGFSEASAGQAFQVMDASWAVRGNLSFTRFETVRVNVTSTVVDWNGNAGGAGARDLVLRRFDGTPMATALFTETQVGSAFVYTASIDLSALALEPDAYYLSIFIDDTQRVFSSTSVVYIGAPVAPHLLETFTDDTFAHPSDVFTPTSVVWVRAVGLAGGDPDVWDLSEYLDGASVVNGPRDGFDNFQRQGNVYTFSIDLARWTGNLREGWSYTLSLRLSLGAFAAFDAGKQIQIHSPTLTVTSTSLAPPRALQGQMGVSMLALTLSVDPWPQTLGPAFFDLDRVRVTRTGVGTNADVAGVRLYEDINGNGALDAGDVLLASRTDLAGVPFPVWLGNRALAAVGVGAPLRLLLTYDIAPAATIGDSVAARIAIAADLDLPGTWAAVNGLPAQSGDVVIAGASVVTVTNNPGVAPPSAVQGQPDVPIDLLRFTANSGVRVVTQISVSLRGSGTPADVASVSLHLDDGDGIYRPTQDPILGSAAAFPANGPAVFAGLNLPVDSVGRSVWIVYAISSAAQVGDRVGSRLPDNTSVVVTGATVYGGTFPLDSGLVTVSGPTLTVTPRNLAPTQARQGRVDLPMLQLTLSVDFGQATVGGLRIDKRGTSTLDSDVPLAKVWLDNGDGLFASGDTLLGQQAFLGGTTVIGGLNLAVSSAATRVLFVTFDISATATLGVTVSARLANPGYVSVDPATTVGQENFPITSSAVLLTAPGSGALLTIGSVDMAAWSPRVYLGQTGVPMEKLYLTADANAGTVTGIRVNKVGTSSSDADVAAVHLVRDADGDGNVSSADAVLATTSFVTGVAIFGNLNLRVAMNEPVTLFLLIDVAPGATLGQTVALRLADASYVAVNATTTVDANSFPIRSSEVTIYGGSLSGFVRDDAGHPVANATVRIPQLNRTATTDAAGAYAFANLPMGTYYVIVEAPGFQEANRTVALTTAVPDQVLNVDLTPVPRGIEPALFLVAIAIGGLLALLILGSLLFLLVRRRSRCPVCGKPKAPDREVCPECEAKGLHPPGAVPPPPAAPPPQPPASPPSP